MRYGSYNKSVVFPHTLVINLFSISCETAIMWMPQDLTDDKLTLVHVMVWCHGQSWQSKHNKTPLMMLYFQTSFRQLGTTLSAKFWTWIHFYCWWVFYIFMAITNGTWVHFTKSLWTHNLNLVKNTWCSCMKNNNGIRLQVCTCHDSWAVLACANVWPDWILFK